MRNKDLPTVSQNAVIPPQIPLNRRWYITEGQNCIYCPYCREEIFMDEWYDWDDDEIREDWCPSCSEPLLIHATQITYRLFATKKRSEKQT